MQSQTTEGLTSTLEGLQDDLDAAMGAAYNTTRNAGMREQIDYLNGETGDRMKEAYALIGTYQADLVNKQEELERDAITSVMDGVFTGDWSDVSDEYKQKLAELMADYDTAQQEEDGAEMGRIIAAAQALAQAEYTNTESYQQQVDANEELLDDVQEAVAGSYWQAGYDFAQNQSQGYQAGLAAAAGDLTLAQQSAYLAATNPGAVGEDDPTAAHFVAGSHAYGLDYVPYDDYPAMLHEGERVLTASQARSMDVGSTVTIAKLADTIVVREDADIDRMVSEIVERLTIANLIYGG